ncbi:MAG: hypothetical protein DRO04_00980, partial [Candidatus Iainarchaeum archaeon]
MEEIKEKLREFWENLKEFYYKLEDKWYDFLDALEERGIHVYKVIDFFESRNIRTFPLAIGIVLLVLIGIGITLSGVFAVGKLGVYVYDVERNPIDAEIKLSYDSTVEFFSTENGYAKLEVPIGKEITITVVKEGYKEQTLTFKVETAEMQKDVILEKIKTTMEKTILLKNAADNSIIEEPVTVYFSCTEAEYTKEIVATDGTVTLDDIPLSCGMLQVTVEKYKPKQDVIDLKAEGSAELLLEEIPAEYGKVVVSVRNENDEPLAGITVRLFTASGAFYAMQPTAENGVATFENVVVGSYYVAATDETGNYESYINAEETKNVTKDEITKFDIIMKLGVVGKVRLKVLDEDSLLPVANAKVKLIKRVGDKQLESNAYYTDNEGKVEIPVADAAEYTARVDHPEYLILEKPNVHKTDEGIFIEVYLQKATAANSRTLKVRTVDENEKPIANARVQLQKNGVPFGEEKATGADGWVFFERLEEGTYQVYAYKVGYGETLSKEVMVVPRQENKITVTLPIGYGTITFKVLDEEKNPIEGARITIYNVADDSVVEQNQLTNSEGEKSINVRADLTVYAYIEADGFSSYITSKIKMAKDATIEKEVVLIKNVPKLSIEPIGSGIFANNEEVKDNLAANRKYKLRFLLKVPKGSNFNEVGVHFRAGKDESGKENLMENDFLYFSEVYSYANKERRGKSYTPPLGYAKDLKHLTNGSCKWFELRWFKPKAQVYEIEAELNVKDAMVGEIAKISFRAWGKTGAYARVPADKELKNLEATSNKQALYANTKAIYFTIGPSNLCNNDICSILSIEDLVEGIETSIIDEYHARVANPYKLSFTVSNIGSNLEGVKLKIRDSSKSLIFSNYSATVAGAQQSAAVNKPEIELNVGTFAQYDSVSGDAYLVPQKSGTAMLTLELYANKQKVWEKKISINVEPAKEIKLEMIPKTIVPFIKNQLLFKATDAQTKEAIENAIINIEINGINIVSLNTDYSGVVEYELNPPKNGDKMKIIVEKAGYKKLVKEIKISEQILLSTPERIDELLVITGVNTKELAVTLNNPTELELKIADIKVEGLAEYVRVDFKESYVNNTLEKGKDFNIVFQISLKEKALKIEKPITVNGSIDLYLENENFSKWVFKIPLSIRIVFGEELVNKNCLLFKPKEWKIYAFNTPKTLELNIKNTCKVKNKAVLLRSLSAKVEWGAENAIGEFKVEVNGNTIELEKDYKELMDILPENADITLKVTFIPERVRSAKASPKILFKAVNKTTHGDEILEQSIISKIEINNLAECVKLSGLEYLVVETCPTNIGWGNYRYYNVSRGMPRKEWLVRTKGYYADRQVELYGYRNPSRYYAEPYYDSYNMQMPMQSSWACGQAMFRIENSCTSDVEISLEAHPFLNVEKSEVSLRVGESATIRVGESYRIGRYPITVKAKIKGSAEPSAEIGTAYVLIKSPTEVNHECIKLTSPGDGIFRFNNWPIVEPVKGVLKNYCYDLGVRLTENSVTAQSFGGGTVMVTNVRVTALYERPKHEGKTVQVLEFE